MSDKEVTLKPGESVKITVPTSENPRPCLRKGDRVRFDGMFGTVESTEDMHGIWVDLEIGHRKQLTLCRYCDLELIPANPAPTQPQPNIERVLEIMRELASASHTEAQMKLLADEYNRAMAPPAPALPGEWRDYPDANGLWLCYKNGRPGVAILVVVTNRPQAFHQDWRILSFRTPIQHDPAHRWLRLPDAPSNA